MHSRQSEPALRPAYNCFSLMQNSMHFVGVMPGSVNVHDVSKGKRSSSLMQPRVRQLAMETRWGEPTQRIQVFAIHRLGQGRFRFVERQGHVPLEEVAKGSRILTVKNLIHMYARTEGQYKRTDTMASKTVRATGSWKLVTSKSVECMKDRT